jgi:hypothetical protein
VWTQELGDLCTVHPRDRVSLDHAESAIGFRNGIPTWLLSVVVAGYRFTIRIRRSAAKLDAWCLQLRACRAKNPGAIAGVLSGGGEHATRLVVEAVSLAFAGRGRRRRDLANSSTVRPTPTPKMAAAASSAAPPRHRRYQHDARADDKQDAENLVMNVMARDPDVAQPGPGTAA